MSLASINALLSEILPDNRFYAEKLGVAGPFESLDEFSGAVPFTTKDELAVDQEAHPPYGTNLTYPLEFYHRFHQTSGTRGKPLVWLDNAQNWTAIRGDWRWVWETAGARKGDSAFFPFSFGPFLGFWAAFDAAAEMGVRAIAGGGLSSDNRLRMMEVHRPTFLCCTPTYALRLAEAGVGMGLDVAGLGTQCLIVCGEPGGSIPEVRDRIAEAWDAAVFDHHGMTEVGPVTVTDREDRNILRIQHGSYFAEVIDPESGNAVPLGQVGELVLTTLMRWGSPLVRYRTGDLVKPVGVEGVDENHFALEGGIIGRADDMVVIRGVNIYPSAIEAVVRSLTGIGEYQVEVDERGAMPEIRLQIENSTSEDMEGELEGRLREVFSMRIPVTAVESGTLPVFEVKANRWKVICE